MRSKRCCRWTKFRATTSVALFLISSGLTAGTIPFTKEFVDDPVPPGSVITLRFTISPAGVLTDLAFTDDLNASLPGLIATGLPLNNVCGTGSVVSGSSVITLTGGNGRGCSFDVTLAVPANAAEGEYLNTTSGITGNIDGVPAEGDPAQDTLTVEYLNRLTLEKSFLDDPALPGDLVSLEFTLTSLNEGDSATGITFTDDLDASLPGLVAVGLPQADVCGPGSSVSGDSVVTLTDGSLPAAGSCTFAIVVQIPNDASKQAHLNTTSTVEALFDGSLGSGDAASDYLHVGLCTEPDRGDGTTILPPGECAYVWSMQSESLLQWPQAGMQVSARLHQYDCVQPGCETPGGTLGGAQHLFDATVTVEFEGTGELAGFHRVIDMIVAPAAEIDSAPRTLGDPVQSFQTDLLFLQAAYDGFSVGDPDFFAFTLVIQTAPGSTTLTDLGDGTFDVFSYFDALHQFVFTGAITPGPLQGITEEMFDNTRLLAVVPDSTGLIFTDGFESGDTSAWSSTVE